MSLIVLLGLQVPLQAVHPSASILPGNTKLHISVPDVFKLENSWKKTSLSQIFTDPKLKPFIDDVVKDSTFAKLGLNWDDLNSVAKGELSISVIPITATDAGHVFTLYTNGQKMPLLKLIAKSVASLEKQGYKVGKANIAGFTVSSYIRAPQDQKEKEHTLYSFTKDEITVIADNEKAVEIVLNHWAGSTPDRLDQTPAYQKVDSLSKSKAKTGGDFFWFLEPIGLAELERGALPVAPHRGIDLVKILKEEGFTEFQGMGGYVSLGQGDYDILHQTAVYAPGPYQKSMRMVKTLEGGDFNVPDWVPGDVGKFAILYFDLQNAFQNLGPLFDAIYGEGEAGTFDDILRGLRDDPNGPQVDVSKEIISRLGRRIHLLLDTQKPIGPTSVQSLVAIDTKDEKGLAQAVQKLMENDEDVKRHNVSADVVLWELITKERKKKGGKTITVAKAKAPSKGVAVARGQIFLASDITFLKKVLEGANKSLAGEADFQRIAQELKNLGAGKDCLRSFSRPADDLQTVYEMVRTNQLDKARSFYARILIALFGDNVRRIDGSRFPPYDDFSRHLGPTGIYCDNQTEGWLMVGCALRKK